MLQILGSSVSVKLLARAKLIFQKEQPDDFFFCGEPWINTDFKANETKFNSFLQ